MQCPYCHSNVEPGIKICPVCHGDIEAGLKRAQEASSARRIQPTQPMPQQQSQQPQQNRSYSEQNPYSEQNRSYNGGPAYQQQGQQPQYAQQQQPQDGSRGAVQMDPSRPDRSQQPLRSFDTDSMKKSPKWPIVLIVVLIVVIVVALILVFQLLRPNTSGTLAENTSATATSQSSSASSDASEAAVSAQSEQAAVQEQSATSAQTDANTVYQTLNTAYSELAGFDTRIKDVATQINNGALDGDAATLQSALTTATQVQTDIANAANTVTALDATGTQYETSKATISQLYNDLSMRISVLVEALQKASNGEEIGDTLTRDNGSDGVNIYKADYDAVYPTAAPAAPAA